MNTKKTLFGPKEERIIDKAYLYTDCKNDKQVRDYLDSMYDAGYDIYDILEYFDPVECY